MSNKRKNENDESSHKKCNGSQMKITIDHTQQQDAINNRRLLGNLRYGDRATADIRFIVESCEILAHKPVIEILKDKRQLVREAIERDKKMAKEENSEEASIFQMSGTTARAFRKLLEYIYNGFLSCDVSTAIELATTAIKLKFHSLVASLAQHFEYQRSYCLSLQTVDDLYHIAKSANNKTLTKMCTKLMNDKSNELNKLFLKRDVSKDSTHELIYAFDKSRYINYIQFKIPDDYEICFNVLVSNDRTNWTVVLKNDEIFCKFWNWVFFEERRIKFIKILVNDGLKAGQSVQKLEDKLFECRRSNIPLEFDKSTKYLIPKHDVIKFPIADTKYYFDEFQPKLFTYCMSKSSEDKKMKDYYYHNIGDKKFIEFYLSQTCLIDSFSISLWNADNRTYDFKVEIKNEIEDEYNQIKDENCSVFKNKSSKVTINLRSRRAVRWIKLTGLRGPDHDTEFAVVDVECPALHTN